MSHSTQVVITTSNGISLDLSTGSRQLAEEYFLLGVCASKSITGESAAILLNDRKFLAYFAPNVRGLIAHLFSIEDAWEEEMNSVETPSWFNNEVDSYKHLQVTVYHRD